VISQFFCEFPPAAKNVCGAFLARQGWIDTGMTAVTAFLVTVKWSHRLTLFARLIGSLFVGWAAVALTVIIGHEFGATIPALPGVGSPGPWALHGFGLR